MRIHLKKWHLMTIILTLVLLISSVGIAYARNEKFNYVALGDSLAAGYTPNRTIDKSYTDFLAEKLEGEGVLGDFQNFGVPGYKTIDVLASIDSSNPDNKDRILAISNADIITLDVGANDLLYLITDSSGACSSLKTVAESIAEIILTLKNINPNAKIYIMGYYNAFPYYTEEQQNQLIPLIQAFNSAIENVANLYGATYVDTYATMDKHLEKYLPENNIHPDLLGYRAIAGDFWDIIKVDFLRGLN